MHEVEDAGGTKMICNSENRPSFQIHNSRHRLHFMPFSDIEFLSTYDSGFGDIDVVENFYVPLLEQSIRYDRVAGYFSSRVFASAARGVAGLVRNGGKMRLVTSHAFTPSDTATFQNHFESDEFSNKLIADFISSFNELGGLKESIAKSHVAAMCWMLREGFLEIKVVVPNSADLTMVTPEDFDKFHPKFGICVDSSGNQVAFSGSVNETEGAWRRNIENFDVYQSWLDGESKWINPKIKQFEKLWNNNLFGQWKTIDLPSAVKHKIISDFAPDDFPKEIENLAAEFPWGLRSYQNEALEKWISAGRRGMLEMATGTGKTRTARACISSSAELGKLLTIVVVPYQHIGDQWSKELSEFSPVNVGGDWRTKLEKIKHEVILGRRSSLTLIVVKNTASKDDFVKVIGEMATAFDNTLFVGDEVHWLGAPEFKPSLVEVANFRLGLSATPRRYFDEEGTDFLIEYFNGTVYELSIKKALGILDENGNAILCPYEYYPQFVELSDDELAKYRELTAKIGKLKAIKEKVDTIQLEYLYNQRSAIVKSAGSKIPGVKMLLEQLPKPLNQCLIYCSDFDQLRLVAEILHEMKIDSQQVTGAEGTAPSDEFGGISEREYIIQKFAQGHIGVLLAIKCLDEGVDIPSAKMGIILASSGNTKEFIQRRGRLMRPFPGKEIAKIYDFCVLPENVDDPVNGLALVTVELARILEFAEDAANYDEVHEIIGSRGVITNV
jgi:superfamily II DNA or RNA helicase